MTEAETRIFTDTAERAAPETQYYNQRPTGPSYLAPSQTAMPQGTQTKALDEARSKRNRVILGSLFVLLLIVAITFVAAMSLSKKRAATTSTTTTRPEIPVPPGVPQPPVPPVPPTAGTTAVTALDYPGAEVTMEMTRGNEGSIRQLHTSDSFDKVVAWYKDKLKPSDPITTRDKDGSSAVLNGAAATAIVTSDEEEGTQILLKKGIDR